VHFDATVASLTLKPRRQAASPVDPEPHPSAPRLSFAALQHTQTRETLLVAPFRKRPEGVALPPGSSALRVWLPSRRFQVSQAPGSLSQPPTLVGLPLQSFPPPQWSKESFDPLIRPCAFPRNPHGFGAALRRFHPTMEAVPLVATGWIRPGRGPCFSWAFRTSQALPPSAESLGRLSRRMTLTMLASLTPRGVESPHSQGVSGRRPGVFPHGMPACLAFMPTPLATSLKTQPPADYFFLSKVPGPLRNPSALS